MHCPKCHHDATKVKESRSIEEGFAVRRRRECDACSFRFSTREGAEILGLTVMKKDGSREAYHKDKLEAGVLRALEKRDAAPEDVRRLIDGIERDIQKTGKREVASRDIGRIVMAALKAFDRVAYIRFASVYRSFNDIDDFEQEVKTLQT